MNSALWQKFEHRPDEIGTDNARELALIGPDGIRAWAQTSSVSVEAILEPGRPNARRLVPRITPHAPRDDPLADVPPPEGRRGRLAPMRRRALEPGGPTRRLRWTPAGDTCG